MHLPKPSIGNTLLASVFALGACATCATASAQVPSGEEVIQKFIDITGGADAYAKLKTRISTGTIAMAEQNMTGQISIYQKAPNITRVIGNIGGVTFDRGYDGQTAFEVNSMMGTRIIEGDERDLMELQSLSNPLSNLAKAFTNMENTGIEPIDGRDTYKIELTLKSGEKFTEWFDVETGLLAQMLMKMDTPGAGQMEITIISTDWRDVDGVKVPFKMKQFIEPFGIKQTIEFTKIENNVQIPPEKLELPEDVKDFLKDTGTTQPTTQPAGGK